VSIIKELIGDNTKQKTKDFRESYLKKKMKRLSKNKTQKQLKAKFALANLIEF
jgi:hypothetical protein